MTQEFPKEYQDRAPGEYPKEAQNPKQEPGLRPGDQPAGKVRVPDDEPDVEEMTTNERLDPDPKRKDVIPPADSGSPSEDAVREMGRR